MHALRAEGDRNVFFVDTTGWLDQRDESGDFDLSIENNEKGGTSRRRVSAKGNLKVAAFLGEWICRFLTDGSQDDGGGDSCAFRRPEVYEGRMFKPVEEAFGKWVEDRREELLMEGFFGGL